jgi:hypothetical protein
MKKSAIRAICYVFAIFTLVLGAVPIFRFWQQAQSGKADYQQEVYFNYNGLLAAGILLAGLLVAAVLLWIARKLTR